MMCSQFGYVSPPPTTPVSASASSGDAITILLTLGLLLVAVVGPVCCKAIDDGELFEGY
tara:strand:- start:1311 stop:1487 length:177 start_codon:yes stop_codon:yes gene_type:complete